MSVNANSFSVMCSVIASAALTRDRVLYFLPRKKKFYYVIDIKHLFHCNRLLYYLRECFLPNTWVGQQCQYVKYGGDNPVANKTITLGQVVTNFTAQVVTSCVCVCMCVCVCVLQRHSRIHHISLETIHFYVYIKRKPLSFL